MFHEVDVSRQGHGISRGGMVQTVSPFFYSGKPGPGATFASQEPAKEQSKGNQRQQVFLTAAYVRARLGISTKTMDQSSPPSKTY